MKNTLKFTLSLAALAIMIGTASSAMAQIVGGYKTIETTDEQARAAAEWAVRDKGEKAGTGIELLTLLKAERQVVQGMNYRLCMKINTEGQDEPVSMVQTVVYMDLKKNYKQSGWTTVTGCETAKPQTPSKPTGPARPPIVGGYKVVEATDADARAAAEWAVREKGEKTERGIELLTLVKAERQLVQGSNYRVCMKINTEGADEPVSFVQAVIYVDLKGNYKLSSWEAAPCGN